MISPNLQRLYKRLLVLGLLSGCLAVFGFGIETRSVYAAGCIQDCQSAVDQCDDECVPYCSDLGDATCEACLGSCASTFNSCMAHAVYCTYGESPSYSPRCEVFMGLHCPLDNNGHPDCRDEAGAHYAYTLVCQTLGGGHCVACPDDPNYHCVADNDWTSCYPEWP